MRKITTLIKRWNSTIKRLKLNPILGHLKIGALYANKGMLNEAKETFENVVRLYPQDPGSEEAYVSLGLMSLNEKKRRLQNIISNKLTG